jgi:predicted CxxxxCH...CXXCH cytochrome family protein
MAACPTIICHSEAKPKNLTFNNQYEIENGKWNNTSASTA